MIKKFAVAAALLTTALAAPASAADIKLGVLSCDIDGGTGYVITSNKGLDCTFKSSRGGGREHYTGMISKLGVDLGKTHQGSLQWAVLAVSRNYDEGQLAGNYFGVNAEASVVTGGGANLLTGGFRRLLHPAAAQRAGTDRPERGRCRDLDRAHFLAEIATQDGWPEPGRPHRLKRSRRLT